MFSRTVRWLSSSNCWKISPIRVARSVRRSAVAWLLLAVAIGWLQLRVLLLFLDVGFGSWSLVPLAFGSVSVSLWALERYRGALDRLEPASSGTS